jgi:hypothetical protein
MNPSLLLEEVPYAGRKEPAFGELDLVRAILGKRFEQATWSSKA